MSILCIQAQASFADNFSWDGKITAEGMIFDNDSVAQTNDQILSFIPELELKYFYKNMQFQLAPMYRWDSFDRNRDMLIFRDSYWGISSDSLDFRIGSLIYQYGSMDILSPLDWINTRVIDGIYPDFQRMGELSVNLKWYLSAHSFEVIFLPHFQAPYWPASTSRLGVGIDFDNDTVVQGDSLSNQVWRWDQWAAVYEYSEAQLMTRFLYQCIIDKSFSLVGIDENINFNRFYYYMDLFGLSSQYSLETITLKGEFFIKKYQSGSADVIDLQAFPEFSLTTTRPENHYGMSIGFDYPIHLKSGQTSAFTVEYQRLMGADKSLLRLYGIFQNDLAIGYQHLFNDFSNSKVKASAIIDVGGLGERIYFLSYQRNLKNNLMWELGARVIDTDVREADSGGGLLNQNAFAGLALVDRSDGIFSYLTYNF